MPFTIRYGSFQNNDFMAAVGKLSRYPFKAQKFAYNLARIVKAVEDNSALANEQFIKLVKLYAKLDDKGEMIPHEANGKAQPGTFSIRDEVVDEWKKALDEFQELTVEIPRWKLKLSELEECRLTAMELLALEDMLDGEEEGPGLKAVPPPAPTPEAAAPTAH